MVIITSLFDLALNASAFLIFEQDHSAFSDTAYFASIQHNEFGTYYSYCSHLKVWKNHSVKIKDIIKRYNIPISIQSALSDIFLEHLAVFEKFLVDYVTEHLSQKFCHKRNNRCEYCGICPDNFCSHIDIYSFFVHFLPYFADFKNYNKICILELKETEDCDRVVIQLCEEEDGEFW